MPDPVIELRGITKTYRAGDNELRALDGVNMTVDRSEFLAIIGSSGSGKSTLMNIIGCLDRPTDGQYYLEGEDTSRLAEPALAGIRGTRIGFVFQSFNLLARTSALENVALPLFYGGSGPASQPERAARARAALRFVGLAQRDANTPSQLSGGQQQRVAIARALIGNPRILLADEPTGNLDTKTSHEIMAMLSSLNREHGVTILVVTHEPDIAAYADRVVTMRDGRIVSDERRRETGGTGAAAAIATRPDILSAGAPVPMPRPGTVFTGFYRMILGTAALALWRNRLRSALTVLGVFVGVAALIAMVAVGQGANEAVRKQIESLGTNLIVVLPGATTTTGMRGGSGSASTLTVADAQAIRRENPAVSGVSYLLRQMGQTQYGGQNWATNILGVTPSYLEATGWHIAIGRPITDDDERDAAKVALIGNTVYQNLFAPGENPVGATLLARGVPLRVVGLLAAKGQSGFGQDQDDVLIVPFSTAEQKVLGVAIPSQAQTSTDPYFPPLTNPYGTAPRLVGYVNFIFVQAASAELVPTAIEQVTETLRRRHRLRPNADPDFAVRNLSQIAQTAEGSSRIMALLLAVVASISLLVGGIGIMNILLVSVTERTREIGLRMAIGARRIHILLQFLAESVFLSLTGGIAGVLFGVATSKLITAVTHWTIVLSPAAVLGGFLFSAAVGVFFGYYPARKAAHMNPIEALRYE